MTMTTTTAATDRIIAEFQKNGREMVRISLTTYHGAELLDIRVYWQNDLDQWKPGRGIALRREQLPQLLEALQAAQAAVEAGEAE